jgi:mRNA-degrading endonuclease RelE of RelBE toxin-antitoxin system
LIDYKSKNITSSNLKSKFVFSKTEHNSIKIYQLTFSKQSLSELNKLAKDEQLQLVSCISELLAKAFKNDDTDIPSFRRDGKMYYRLKMDTFRVYVEKIDNNSLYCHYILPQHTLSGFYSGQSFQSVKCK